MGTGCGGLVLGQVQVAHGGADGGVSEPALDDGQLHAGLDQAVPCPTTRGCAHSRCAPTTSPTTTACTTPATTIHIETTNMNNTSTATRTATIESAMRRLVVTSCEISQRQVCSARVDWLKEAADADRQR